MNLIATFSEGSASENNRRVFEIIPDIKKDTTWKEWEENFSNNIYNYIETHDKLSSKWTPDSLLKYYKENINYLADLAYDCEINKILFPSDEFPYKRNALEYYLTLADTKAQNAINSVVTGMKNFVEGVKGFKSGILMKTPFCSKKGSPEARSLPFEPFITKILDHPRFGRKRRSISKKLE